MGIQDRDYYREGLCSLLDAWGRQGAVVWIIIITTVVFFLQCFSGGPDKGEVFDYGKYAFESVRSGEIWRLITPLFLHATLWHLFFNMLVLYWAGSRMEEIYGSREIVIFYFAAGLFASVVYLLAQVIGLTDKHASMIGASGAVMAVLVLFALHFPHQRVLLFFVIPVPIWLLVIFYVLWDVFGASTHGAGIAYFAHLGGALFGLIYYQSHFRFSSLFFRVPRSVARKARPTLRILPVEPEGDTDEPVGAAVESQQQPKESAEEHLEAKLDRVLEKMSKHGQDSLTTEERDILVKASELFKKRRK